MNKIIKQPTEGQGLIPSVVWSVIISVGKNWWQKIKPKKKTHTSST